MSNHYPEKSGARLVRSAIIASICGLGMCALFVWAFCNSMGWL